jgi:hypothetical protein
MTRHEPVENKQTNKNTAGEKKQNKTLARSRTRAYLAVAVELFKLLLGRGDLVRGVEAKFLVAAATSP